MQSSSAFIRVSVPIPKVRKCTLISDYENIDAYSEQSKQSEIWTNKCGLFLNLFGVSECRYHLMKIWLLLLSFKFGNSVLSTQNDTRLLYKYKDIFFLKTGSLISNWVPLSFSYNHTMPEGLSSQSTLSNSLVNWEQF